MDYASHYIRFVRPGMVLAIGISATFALAVFASSSLQFAFLSVISVMLTVIAIVIWRHATMLSEDAELLCVPLALAADPEMTNVGHHDAKKSKEGAGWVVVAAGLFTSPAVLRIAAGHL